MKDARNKAEREEAFRAVEMVLVKDMVKEVNLRVLAKLTFDAGERFGRRVALREAEKRMRHLFCNKFTVRNLDKIVCHDNNECNQCTSLKIHFSSLREKVSAE